MIWWFTAFTWSPAAGSSYLHLLSRRACGGQQSLTAFVDGSLRSRGACRGLSYRHLLSTLPLHLVTLNRATLKHYHVSLLDV